jgi:Legionella pneumophila major outer membrane protein precursor
MKKMISKLVGMGALCAFLISAQTATGQCCPQPDPCCNPCTDWCDMCGRWEVGAHALLFTPIACEYDFATVNSSQVPAGQPFKITTMRCELDWGFRIFGRFLSDCTFLNVSYQWFQSKAKNTVDDFQVIRDLPAVTAVRGDASTSFEYQNVDVSLGKYLHRGRRCNFFLFGNARWVDLSYQRHTRAINEQGLVFNANEKSKLEGGALGVGAGAEYDLWCDIGLFGSANVLGVIAERSTPNVFAPSDDTQDPNSIVRSKYSSDTCINPEVNFRIGLDYSYTCGCWTLVGELGYELDYFWNAFSFPKGAITNATDRFRQCEDVGFSGLFFGGRLLF